MFVVVAPVVLLGPAGVQKPPITVGPARAHHHTRHELRRTIVNTFVLMTHKINCHHYMGRFTFCHWTLCREVRVSQLTYTHTCCTDDRSADWVTSERCRKRLVVAAATTHNEDGSCTCRRNRRRAKGKCMKLTRLIPIVECAIPEWPMYRLYRYVNEKNDKCCTGYDIRQMP